MNNIEALQRALEALELFCECGTMDRPIERREALRQAIEQAEQADKEGSPCPEFWDWLPKAYNFEGDGNFTKYNMEVAFLAGKQAQQAQQAQPKAVYGHCPECGAKGVLRERRPNGNDKCANGHIYPSASAIKTSPPPRQPLTDEQLKPLIQKAMSYYGHNPDSWHLTAGAGFCLLARAIEAAHGIKDKNT